MDLELGGKTALVTGSTAGIGFAIARRLAREGATVIVNGRTGERVQAAIRKIEGEMPGKHVEGIAADLSKPAAAEQTTKRFPDLDILVNNLGVYGVRSFEDISDEDWR